MISWWFYIYGKLFIVRGYTNCHNIPNVKLKATIIIDAAVNQLLDSVLQKLYVSRTIHHLPLRRSYVT